MYGAITSCCNSNRVQEGSSKYRLLVGSVGPLTANSVKYKLTSVKDHNGGLFVKVH